MVRLLHAGMLPPSALRPKTMAIADAAMSSGAGAGPASSDADPTTSSTTAAVDPASSSSGTTPNTPRTTSLFSSLLRYVGLSSSSSDDAPHPIGATTVDVVAAPGLVTMLDVALYRSYEGELTGTVCATSNVVRAFLELKSLAATLLRAVLTHSPPRSDDGSSSGGGGGGGSSKRGGGGGGSSSSNESSSVTALSDSAEDFARLCLACADEAIGRLTTDRLAESANLPPDAGPPSGGGSSSGGGGGGGSGQGGGGGGGSSDPTSASVDVSLVGVSTGPSGTDASKTLRAVESLLASARASGGEALGGRGLSSSSSSSSSPSLSSTSSSSSSPPLRRRDCWESPRLFCPDYAWADDALGSCQRLYRLLLKHDFVSSAESSLRSYTAAGVRASADAAARRATSFAASSGSGSGSGSAIAEAASVVGAMMGGMGVTVGGEDAALGGVAGGVGGSRSSAPSSSFVPSPLSPAAVAASESIGGLVREGLPAALHRMRRAVESDAAVSKRLYLVKCEYRAPFRAFLEAHAAVQRAPRMDLVDDYLALHGKATTEGGGGGKSGSGGSSSGSSSSESASDRRIKERKEDAEKRIQDALQTPRLVDVLELEQQCEALELGMAQMLLPFSEMARVLSTGKVRIKEVPGVVAAEDVPELQELLRRLKSILCRKPGTESSTGIRPLLLDLQGVPRDSTLASTEVLPFGPQPRRSSDEDAVRCRLSRFLSQLQVLCDVGKAQKFIMDKRERAGALSSLVKASAAALDAELFEAQYLDWYDMARQQRDLAAASREADGDLSFEQLAETIKRAEIEVSIAVATRPALELVRQRLDALEEDRLRRLLVLAGIVNEVGLREMNLNIVCGCPAMDVPLELPRTSALGVFGLQLQMASEPLPLG